MFRSHGLSATLFVIFLGMAINLGSARSTYAQSGFEKVSSRDVYALSTDNYIHQLSFTANGFKGAKSIKSIRVDGVNGNLIGIDFRITGANSYILYGISDTGSIYSITLPTGILGATTANQVSSLGARFAGGFQSLLDFNPVLDAIRLVGSNDQNFAVVNSNGGNLNVTAVQTALTYAAGDPNAGIDPNITGGTYSNNVTGATQTYFYTIDYNLDTLVTIADLNASGSSNTGGGKLKTIGAVIDTAGNPINFAPTADLDIFTDPSLGNVAVIINGRNAYTIDINSINPLLPVGTTQTVVATPIEVAQTFTRSPELAREDFIDIAVTPFAVRSGTIADMAIAVGGDFPAFAKYPRLSFNLVSGQSLTYKVYVENHGPQTVGNVIISGRSGFTNLVLTPSQGTCTKSAPDATGTAFTCNSGSLAKGAMLKITVSGSTLSDLVKSDTFSVSGASDPNADNDSVTVDVVKVSPN